MSEVDLILRLSIAAGLGAVLGLERETRLRAAGIRTHALVSVGAALFTIAGAYGFADIHTSANVDPARVAAQIASGIGFIGAGAIIRHGESVRGVTTAATLWLSGALGLAAGAGFTLAAIVATLLVVAILLGLRVAKTKARQFGRDLWIVSVDYERGQGTLGPILRAFGNASLTVDRIDIDDDGEDVRVPGPRHIRLHIRARDDRTLWGIVELIEQRSEVVAVRVTPTADDLTDRRPG